MKQRNTKTAHIARANADARERRWQAELAKAEVARAKAEVAEAKSHAAFDAAYDANQIADIAAAAELVE
jgi:hypothetical protein